MEVTMISSRMVMLWRSMAWLDRPCAVHELCDGGTPPAACFPRSPSHLVKYFSPVSPPVLAHAAILSSNAILPSRLLRLEPVLLTR